MWVCYTGAPESTPMLPQQRVLAPVFLTLAAVAVRLRAGHALEVLCQDLLGPSGQVLMALLHFLEKLHQFLISGPLSILEILHTSLTTL